MWRGIRRAVSSIESRIRNRVKDTIKQATTFSLQSITNVAIDAGLEYYGIDSDGKLGLTIKAVGNQAVKYATFGSIDGLYKAESPGSYGSHFTDGGTAISASSSGGTRENIGNGLAYLASPGYGLYRDYKKWRETHSVEEHGTLPEMIGKSLRLDRLILLFGNSVKAPLKRIHSDETITSWNKVNYESWRKESTDDIVKSLRPGSKEPLRVKLDGRVFQGNTRIKILQDRGFNVNTLPREILK